MIINQILVRRSDGSTPPPAQTTEHRVQWVDYDGTVLKTEYVTAGNNATPPANPVQANLTFQGWNITATNIQSDRDIGATYITTDGKTHAHIRLTTVTTLNVTLRLNKSDASTLTVDWGDGSAVSTFTNTGNFNTGAKAYASAGDYVITMWISSGEGTYSFGNASTSTTFTGGSTQVQRNALLKLHIGENVTSIGASAFYNCYSLTSIIIPEGVTSIDVSAFNNCYSLTSITIPSSVTTIGVSAFTGCYSLTSITIPSSVTSIGASAFNNCHSLTSIIIPEGVTSIGESAFYFCHSLTSITIPSSVTTIASSAFYFCFSLTSITIPSSVTSIGASAFNNCYSVWEYICLRTTPPTLSAVNALTGINSICKIYVPDASVANYKAATNWSTYANYIYALSTR